MGAARGVIHRLHNPRGRECGCLPECWCQSTTTGRLLRWYLPRSHHTSATPERKRAQQAIRDGADRSRTLQHHATVLLVDSVPKATDYYRDALGFEIEPYDKIPDHYAFAQRDSCSVHFAHWDGVSPRPNSEVVPPDMFDLYVYVEDVDGLYTELRDRGADIIQAPTRQGYGTYEIRVRDPHGYIIAFGCAQTG
jgi:catechol 2,3-dioxygenase-like lactoylglutathione lyase family enzyme